MKIEMTKKDVEQEFDKVVVLNSDQLGLIDLLKNTVGPYGYNAGTYGWNYDVYSLNGIGLVEGYRVPNFRNEARYSKEILNNAADKANEVFKNNRKIENLPAYDREKEKTEILETFKEFTDSVKQGIHDPSVIKTFEDYKREFIDQRKQHPDEDSLSAAKRLDSHFYDENARKKVNSELKKQMKKYLIVNPDKQACLESVLNVIYSRDPEVAKKNIFNDLNRHDRFPDGISGYGELRYAQAVFTGIIKNGKGSCELEGVADYFKSKGAFVKESKDKISWTISFEKPHREKKQDIGIER